MTLTDNGITLRIYTLTQTTCITRKTSRGTMMSCAIVMALSFKTILTATQRIHTTGQAALHTTTPEIEGASLPHSHPQKTLTMPLTTNSIAPLLLTTLLGDHHLILKSVILACGLHIGLRTQHTTHTPEDHHGHHFLASTGPIQG